MVTPALLQDPKNYELAEFLGSMPAAYALAFSHDECAEHAEIVQRRQDRPVHVERWRTLDNQICILCVVAEDEPRLLSLICRVLVELQLEVVSAQIYSRETTQGIKEAVDFFWVRGQSAAELRQVSPNEVSTLERMLGQQLSQSSLTSGIRPAQREFDPIPGARAFFDSTDDDTSHLLTVESRDYPGLLLTITETLHDEHLEIVASDVTTQGSLARDRFLVRDLQGEKLGRSRLDKIRHSVVNAVRRATFRFVSASEPGQK